MLSIQTDILGHATYCKSLRRCFAGFNDMELTSRWHTEGRSFADRLLNKLAHVQVPLLGHNLDLFRARAEWSMGRTARGLANRMLAERSYDLLHFHTQPQAFGSAELMGRIPAVVSIDITAYLASRELTTRHPATYRPSIRMEKRAFVAAAHIVAWSDWARRSVLEDHGIAEDKVTTITPGVNLESFDEPIFERRAKPRVLFMGADFQRKGGWDVLEVFSRHFADRAELQIVTGEDVRPPVASVSVHRGVSSYTPEWHALFRNADLFVMPSYAEALGLVFQEASGYGLALIGSEVGGIPSMIRPGDNGLLVPPGDREALARALASLIDDPGRLMRMRRRSREVALERFDAARNFRAMADLFQRVAGRRGELRRSARL